MVSSMQNKIVMNTFQHLFHFIRHQHHLGFSSPASLDSDSVFVYHSPQAQYSLKIKLIDYAFIATCAIALFTSFPYWYIPGLLLALRYVILSFFYITAQEIFNKQVIRAQNGFTATY